MNSNFQTWVTSTSFAVFLTTPQMKVLRYLQSHRSARVDMLEPMTLFALDKRGLLMRSKSGAVRLTKAGDLLASLVSEAGYTDAALGLPVRVQQAVQHESMLKQATSMLRRGARVASVATQLGVSRATMYRHLKHSGSAKGTNHLAEK